MQIIRMLNESRRRVDELKENFNSIKKDMGTIKNQSKMKDRLNEMNNLQGINSRVDEAENQISNLEHKEAKNKQLEQ